MKPGCAECVIEDLVSHRMHIRSDHTQYKRFLHMFASDS